MPPAKGFGHVVQAGLLGGRVDDRVLGLLDRPFERRPLSRQDLSSCVGVAVLRFGSSLFCCRLLEAHRDAP